MKSNDKYIEVPIDKDWQPKMVKGSLKLNLGCGTKHKPGYINIDINEPCDVRCDLAVALPFENGSVDEIFSEGNFVCHISAREWNNLSREMGRVLKPGGKLHLIFLDFEYILRAFLENKDGRRWGWWWQTIFSAQQDEYDFTKNGFTLEKMKSDLTGEGFGDFRREPLKNLGQEYISLVCYKNEHE